MKKLRREPLLLTTILIVAASLFLFVVYPALRVLLYPDIAAYRDYLGNSRWVAATWNSLVMAVLSTITATAVGFLYAYALVYTDIRGKGLLRTLAILPMISPPFMVAISYIFLFGGRGLITYHLFGQTVNLYGWRGLWAVQTIAFFPYAYQIIAGVLMGINPSLEYAARNLGAGAWRVFRTVTLPLARPGILNAALVIAVYVLADFGNPILIAGNFPLLPTEAYLQISGWYNLKSAAVLSSILLAPALGFFLLQRRLEGRRSYVTVTGKGSSMTKPPQPKLVSAFFAVFCGLIAAIIVAVYGILIAGAFTQTWGVRWTPTLRHWEYVIFRSKELFNSIEFSLVAALTCAVFSLLVAYIVSRQEFPGKRALDFCAVLPAAIPGVFYGIGFIMAFNKPPLALTGTAAIIVLSMIFWNIPTGYRAGIAGLAQIDKSIEEAASNLGADSLHAFKDILLPLLRLPFVTAFVTAFVRAITTLSVVIFLVTPGNNLATVIILGLIDYAEWSRAAAMTTALIVAAFVVLGLAQLATGRKAAIFRA